MRERFLRAGLAGIRPGPARPRSRRSAEGGGIQDADSKAIHPLPLRQMSACPCAWSPSRSLLLSSSSRQNTAKKTSGGAAAESMPLIVIQCIVDHPRGRACEGGLPGEAANKPPGPQQCRGHEWGIVVASNGAQAPHRPRADSVLMGNVSGRVATPRPPPATVWLRRLESLSLP